MNKTLIKTLAFAALLATFSSCSSGEEVERKNPRDNNVLIKAIRTPLDKASGAQQKADQRTSAIDQEYRGLEGE